VTLTAAAAVVGLTKYAVQHAGFSPHPDRLAAIAAQLQRGKPAIVLEKQRQNLILMAAASKSFALASKPKVASQPAVAAAPGGTPAAPAAPAAPPPVSAPIPSPGTAQSIAYKMLPTFGWSASAQFGCLSSIWSRESGWRVNAANASGAYGIPQALPGSKMASAGPDWQTNPATQIKWGLGYIKQRYGSPCNAWASWQAHGWY
jgi:Transglycosylase SLT domain